MFALTSFFSSAIWFQQLTVMIHLSMRVTIASIWRIMVATAVMTAGVLYFMTIWPYADAFAGRVAALAIVVVLGGLLYIGSLLGLWHLVGRPTGPEDHAMRAIPQLLARLGLGSKRPSVA